MAFGVRSRTARSRFSPPRAWTGLLVFALMAIGGTAVDAQTGQITGTITDATSSAPLSEVQVYLVGLQLGSLSRADGRFLILNVPAGTYSLRAERIGLGAVEQEVTVTSGGTAVVDIALESQALGLDEIVVTGAAGSARRREIGNSITAINVADIQDKPVTTSAMLQGAGPGIEITGGDGQAGQGKQIRLRGNSSVAMSNQPIIYVDGIRLMGGAFPAVTNPTSVRGRGAFVTASPLDNINPNDIERIEVIKGSAATTLFGTEASAGVIQIFTKRGSQGAPVWTAEVQQGTGWIQKFGANGVDYMNMEHFLRDSWFGGGYDGGEYSRDCVVAGSEDGFPSAGRMGTDNATADGGCSFPGAAWYQNYYMSVRGGGQALQYFVSGTYQDDVYNMPMDALQKYNFQSNFTFSPANDLVIQWNTGYTNQHMKNSPSGNNLSGLELQSFRQERNYFSSGDPREIGKILDYDFQTWIERLTTGTTINFSPLANMTNRLTVGYDFSQQEVRNLMGFGYWEVPEGLLTNDIFQNRTLSFDYVGTYSFEITGDIRSNFSWGGQATGDDLRQQTLVGRNFPGAASPTISSSSLQFGEEERRKIWNAGFFVQNVFDISNKFFITAGLRVDGNSAFGSGFGLQQYPKVSASYVISDENFWSDAMGTMKLRAAYGKSGRAPGAFDAIRTWDPVGFIGDPAFRPRNLGNPDLGPEVTSEMEFGFDGSWLDDKLSIGFTYYDQTTSDALMNVAGIPSNGFTRSQLRNVGTISNSGIEVQLNAALLESEQWGVDLGLGFSTNNSLIVDMNDIADFNDLNGRIAVGQPVPTGYDRRVANRDAIEDWVYEDGGENVFIGPLLPTHFVLPNLTIRMPGNISIAARGEYRGGNYMEVNKVSISRSVRSPICFPYYETPATAITLKADTPAIWRERCTPSGGDDYWFDADYFKLRSVSAAIPVDFAFPQSVSNATLTLSLNNAFSWYREIPWFDPETLGNNAANDDGIGGFSERTPGPATFRLALRVTF
jgi:outer membrane receptor protein involved in Fe transport